MSNKSKSVKRAYDFVFSLAGLLMLIPVFAVIALAVKIFDGGPVFFRQWRIGMNGEGFYILKFRTMIVDAQSRGLSITKGGDMRVTPIGRFLRRTKLDELPQLWNVLKGEMSLVGPRPEVSKYVERYTWEQKHVLKLKPGITDLATLAFRNEEELLRSVADVEEFYIRHCMPQKISLNLHYAQRANIWEDTKLIIRTIFPARWSKESHPNGMSIGV